MVLLKNFYNENKKTIVIGVIVGLIVAIIILAINYIFSYIIDWFILISPFFSDFYYKSISNYNETDMLNSQYTFISLIFFYVFYKFTSELSNDVKNKLESYENFISDADNIINKEKNKNEVSENDDSSIDEKVIKIKERILLNKNKLIKLKKYVKVFIVSIFIFYTYLHVQTLYYQIISIECNNFNKKMLIIKPYIVQNEYDIIISDWYQIKNKNDYDKIYNKIKKIETKTKGN
jgi:hypothetical protein